MFSIRCGVFETNSSSTHSICICTEDEYEEWGNAKPYLNESGSWIARKSRSPYKECKFLTREQVVDILSSTYENWDCDYQSMTDAEFDEYAAEKGFYTVDTYYDYDGYSSFDSYEEHFTTPSGDEMVVFGKYGYDG